MSMQTHGTAVVGFILAPAAVVVSLSEVRDGLAIAVSVAALLWYAVQLWKAWRGK
jgi:hypothetical protein